MRVSSLNPQDPALLMEKAKESEERVDALQARHLRCLGCNVVLGLSVCTLRLGLSTGGRLGAGTCWHPFWCSAGSITHAYLAHALPLMFTAGL